ncbi:hypothetical protein CPB86DRAFT_162101 [Serendipita vermifera]|nr:hypothetical protein CPB86DRAFT_162101 [Serendipita vermifera]
MPGVWDANEIPALSGRFGQLIISVWMELDETVRYLLGFVELNERELYETIGNQYEVPLMRHGDFPSLVFKTRAMNAEDIQQLTSGFGQQGALSSEERTAQKMRSDALAAWENFERYGDMASLERAASLLEAAIELVPEGSPELHILLNNLGSCLVKRFEQLGRLADLNNALA